MQRLWAQKVALREKVHGALCDRRPCQDAAILCNVTGLHDIFCTERFAVLNCGGLINNHNVVGVALQKTYAACAPRPEENASIFMTNTLIPSKGLKINS